MQESLVKYLAGIMDADGCLSFMFSDRKEHDDAFYVVLHMFLASSDTVDKHGFLETLPALTGMGAVYRETKNAQCRRWTVTKGADIEMLLPRLIKHMVVKGKHWQWMLETRRRYRGVTLTRAQCVDLVAASRKSRVENAGPVKPKSHPTWAWVAGYLDGDGHYSFKSRNKKNGCLNIYVGATAHVNDVIALDLLQKAFGGRIMDHVGAAQVKRWRRNLGPRDGSFALRFLPKVVNHSRLKKHAIEQILHIHSQRLSVSAPTGGATV